MSLLETKTEVEASVFCVLTIKHSYTTSVDCLELLMLWWRQSEETRNLRTCQKTGLSCENV